MGTINTRLEWLRARLAGIGSSDSPVLVLGKVFDKTPVHVYIDKTRAAANVRDEGSDNPNLRRGNRYEPLGIEDLRAVHGSPVYAPETDAERFNTYRVAHPECPHMYADFDGCTGDYWIVEVKAPVQFVCDQIREHGLKDYYQIQSQHHAHVAWAAGTPAFGPGLCLGTIVVIYEPERACIQVYRVPRDPEMGANIQALIDRFWQRHVVPRVPPLEWGKDLTLPKPAPKKAADKYTPVTGPTWQVAVDDLLLARELAASAARREAAAKETLQAALETAALERVQVGKTRLSFALQQGRTTVNMDLLRAENPQLDWARYEQRGSSFRSFRVYGPKGEKGADVEGLDSALTTLAGELDSFARADLDGEAATLLFDDLRARAEVYASMLRAELGAIENGLERATTAAVQAALGSKD